MKVEKPKLNSKTIKKKRFSPQLEKCEMAKCLDFFSAI